MSAQNFRPEAGGTARQINVAGDNYGAFNMTIEKLRGGLQLQLSDRSALNVNLADASDRSSVPDGLAAGSVEAPFGRLPKSVLGREDVVEAIGFGRGADTHRIQVLSGMGGIGKTTVALTVADLAREANTEIYWISATSTSAVADGMIRVALMVGAPVEHVVRAREAGARPAADLTWRHLASYDRPWMLVFDDADDLDALSCEGVALADGTGWVRPPVGKSQGVIVTTRDRNPRSWGGRITSFHTLEVLDTQAAGQVLRAHVPVQAGEAADAEELAERLGRLPLALHLAGNYLTQAQGDPLAHAQTFEEYTKLLSASPLPLDDILADVRGDLSGVDSQARKTIAGTWGLSLDLLERQGVLKSRALLRVLSCFAPATPLPRTLVDPRAIAEFGASALALTPEAATAAIRGLHRFGLLEVVTSSAEPLFQLHRLVAEVAVAPLVASPDDHRAIWDTAADLLMSATPNQENPRDPNTWPAWQQLAPHWGNLLVHSAAWKACDDSRLAGIAACGGVAVFYLHFRGDYSAACELADRALHVCASADIDPSIIAHVRRHRTVAVMGTGNLKEAESEFDRIIEFCTSRIGEEPPMTVSARYDRARVTTLRGKYAQAEIEYDQVIRHEEKLYGSHSVETLLSRHARAICIRSMGRLAEAATEGERVLTGLRSKLGPTHPDVLQAQHELAVSLRDRGNHADAAAMFRDVRDSEAATLGADHPATLISQASLAVTLMMCDDFALAESEIRSVIDSRTRVLGPDHYDTLDARATLALILIQSGELDAQSAVTEFNELVAGFKDQLVDDHPNVLVGRGRRAAALGLLGERINAESEHHKVLEASSARYGEDHPATLNARHKWAVALGALGRTDEAVAEMRNTLALQETLLGNSHPNTISAQQTLGALLLDQGLLAEAEEVFENLLDRLPEGSDRRHDVQHDLAATQLARGKLPQAIKQLREIADQSRLRYGPTHPDTFTARNNFAIALKEFGKLDEAAKVYRETLSDATLSRLEQQPIVLTLRHGLAVVLREQGILDGAASELATILEVQKQNYGPEHPEALNTRKSLARVLDAEGRFTEAESEYRDIQSIYSRTLSSNHPKTLFTQGNLAFCLMTQGRHAEAETEYRDALDQCQSALGCDHPETLRMEHNLAMALVGQKEFPEAITRLDSVVQRRVRALGADHSETLTARINLGETLYQAKNPAMGAEQFQRVAEARAIVHDSDDDMMWDARARRAQLLWEAGQPCAANSELEALLDEGGKNRPKNDPRVIAAQRVLPFIQADAGLP